MVGCIYSLCILINFTEKKKRRNITHNIYELVYVCISGKMNTMEWYFFCSLNMSASVRKKKQNEYCNMYYNSF